jgi:hypothetical protein
MATSILLAILFALASAFIGVVYATVVAGESSPLDSWFDFLNALHEQGGWPSWIAKPLGACAKCTSGHIALWGFSTIEPWALSFDSFFLHALAASAAVIFAHALATYYAWLKNHI